MILREKLLVEGELPTPMPPPTWEATGYPSIEEVEQLPVRRKKSSHPGRCFRRTIAFFGLPVLSTAEGDIGRFPDYDDGRGRE